VSYLVAVVGDRGRLRDSVRYALREGRDAAQERPVTARFVVTVGDGPDDLPGPAADALVGRIREVVAGEQLGRLAVETTTERIDGTDPDARVRALVDALPPETSRVILSPELEEFAPSAVAGAVADDGRAGSITVERAPVGREIRRPPLALPRTFRRTAATFGLSLGFYLLLGDPTDPFDLATGVVSAAVVAAVLSRVALESEPTRATLGRLARATLFVPYLLYAVVRANLAMAVVVLHPRLPVDPSVVRVPAPEGRLARALLANSITLTPGTLTVDLVGDELVVHALTRASRADLETGSLARAVAFVVDGTARPATGPTTGTGPETGSRGGG